MTSLIPVLTGRGLVVWFTRGELARYYCGVDRQAAEAMSAPLGEARCECEDLCRCQEESEEQR